jgi:hypothetical protein
MKCDWIVPQKGWRQDANGETVFFGDACGYFEAHPEVLVELPEWAARELLASPGWRPHHCNSCSKQTAPPVTPMEASHD